MYQGTSQGSVSLATDERAKMNFATVAGSVRLIDDGWSTPLVVPWGDAMERVRRQEQDPTPGQWHFYA